MNWPEIYGRVITTTGWTWDTVDALTVLQLNELQEYWAGQPPLHELVARFLGFERPEPAKQASEDDVLALLRQMNPESAKEMERKING